MGGGRVRVPFTPNPHEINFGRIFWLIRTKTRMEYLMLHRMRFISAATFKAISSPWHTYLLIIISAVTY